MNDVIFTNGFMFRTMMFDGFHYTDNRVGVRCHYFAQLLSGRCRIVTNTETVEIHEGDIFYIPNKCSYQSYWYGEPEIKFISLGFLYLPNFGNKTYPVQVIPHNKAAAKLFDSLSSFRQMSAYDVGVFYTLVGVFYTLVGVLMPLMSHKAVCRTREIVEQTENYLMNNPFAPTSDLAKNCAISEAALYSAFKKSSDVTPNEMRNRLILEKAKDMLITTDMPREYISDFLRFSSTSYFRKKFKQYFNTTPKEMRKRYRI